MAALSWKPEMVGPGQKAVTVTEATEAGLEHGAGQQADVARQGANVDAPVRNGFTTRVPS